jgi:hypothetical protein
MPSTSRRPGEHVFDNRIGDLAFGLEHFEHLIAEELFYIMGFRPGCDMKYPITGKATVCDNGMQMGIEILKLTESLNSDSGAGGGIIILDNVFQVGA